MTIDFCPELCLPIKFYISHVASLISSYPRYYNSITTFASIHLCTNHCSKMIIVARITSFLLTELVRYIIFPGLKQYPDFISIDIIWNNMESVMIGILAISTAIMIEWLQTNVNIFRRLFHAKPLHIYAAIRVKVWPINYYTLSMHTKLIK